ncbi:MAG TPA: hypothetical protein VHS06_00055 [Chloroflexota bacterium]|nr:hypothetical protein [Chloroflexota bacterium]
MGWKDVNVVQYSTADSLMDADLMWRCRPHRIYAFALADLNELKAARRSAALSSSKVRM